MAIAINPHTYSGILFDSPANVLAWFVLLRSRADNFLCSALVSFGGKKDVIGFVLCCRAVRFVLGPFFVVFGLYCLGCCSCSRTIVLWSDFCLSGHRMMGARKFRRRGWIRVAGIRLFGCRIFGCLVHFVWSASWRGWGIVWVPVCILVAIHLTVLLFCFPTRLRVSGRYTGLVLVVCPSLRTGCGFGAVVVRVWILQFACSHIVCHIALSTSDSNVAIWLE